jgi:DNA polymerase III subunit delta'
MKSNIYPWQDELNRRLEGMVERLPHAILIHGPKGVGKLAMAEHFAQRLLCESSEPGAAPCGRCEGCRWVRAGSHPDLRRLEPEALARRLEDAEADYEVGGAPGKAGKHSTEIKVEQIRDLDGFLNIGSHRAHRRIALIHPAEDMNANAANALLKSLEEPPAGAFFLLVSHRPARLLATIRSRCVALPIGIPDPALAVPWLEAQGVKEARKWLAYASGAPLAALGLAQEASPAAARLRAALDARDLETLRAVNDRESLEALAEALQKYALDRAFGELAGRGKYGSAKPRGSGQAWLRYARLMGRNRALARHPLNPRLFAGEMLAEMPED